MANVNIRRLDSCVQPSPTDDAMEANTERARGVQATRGDSKLPREERLELGRGESRRALRGHHSSARARGKDGGERREG